ncbi:MAG: hypothetical protein OXI81_10765 [Paracoccaceae bacterium]|nr:hypothetical protein [Paracoccaceae bacterium]
MKEFLEQEGWRAALPVFVAPALPAATTEDTSPLGEIRVRGWAN